MTDEPTPDEPAEPRRWPVARPTSLALTLAGLLYAAAGAWVLADDVRLADGRWLGLLLALVAGAGALALLIDFYGAPDRPARRPADRGILLSIVAWLVIVPIIRTLWMRADVPPQLLGLTDRVLLLPVVALGVVWLGWRLGLRGWVTVLAALSVVGGVMRESDRYDWPQELVSAAGAPDLAAAREQDRTIALRGVRHDRGAGVAPPPRRAGMRCQRISGTDQRRTLVGAAGRRLELRAEACWLRDGTPFSVQVVAFAAAQDSRADPLATQVTSLDPFGFGGAVEPARLVGPGGMTVGAAGVRYGRSATTAACGCAGRPVP